MFYPPVSVSEADDPDAWDAILAEALGAHPLQAWAWGEAKSAEGTEVLRLIAHSAGVPLALAQVLVRRVAGTRLRLGWIARGPAFTAAFNAGSVNRVTRAFGEALGRRGIHLTLVKPYLGCEAPVMGVRLPLGHLERTFIVDLRPPVETLAANLQKNWRNNRSRFFSKGGIVRERSDPEGIEGLLCHYRELAERKGFHRYGDRFIRSVWARFRSRQGLRTRAHLFAAVMAEKEIGWAFIIRLGNRAHYMWGSFAYEARALCPSEGVQWAAMTRLKDLGVTHYDLEGADPRGNPGVYSFKSKMGGALVELPPYRLALTW